MFMRSIRFKTTLLYSGILLMILIAYNTVLFFAFRSVLVRDIDEELTIKAREIINVLQAYEKIKDVAAHPIGILESLLQKQGVLPNRSVVIDDLWKSEFETLKLKKDYINILNAKGQWLIHSNNVDQGVHDLFANHFGFSVDQTYFGTIRVGLDDLRVINLPFPYKKNFPLTIQVATSMRGVYEFLARFMLISSVCIIVTILFTSFLGAFFVRSILNPVVAVTSIADNISHRDLGRRIERKDMDVEMKRLVDSFNNMLERLERSFIHINEFNSYVAHELKTPLAIVKGELELAIEQAPEHDETKKALADCLEEVDRMITITKDLLLLAKLDYKPQILKIERTDLNAFLEQVREFAKVLCSEKNITLTSEVPQERLFIQGDAVHLRRLFLNILTNAVKYTPEGGKVHVALLREEDRARVDISDTGEGIAESDLVKIFEKFYRVDKGGRTPEAGSGLGLSIALSIAKAHQGDIKVKSRPNEGTTFSVILPLSS